jgi:hypothetical protein
MGIYSEYLEKFSSGNFDELGSRAKSPTEEDLGTADPYD